MNNSSSSESSAPAGAAAPQASPPRNDPSQPQPTILQGLQTISPSDFKSLSRKPCVRDSLLVGLGAGFAVGGSRFIFSSAPRSSVAPGMASGTSSRTAALAARQWRAMSWAMGAFIVGSMGMHVFCQQKRYMERENMKMVQEAVNAKREKKQLVEEKRRNASHTNAKEKGSWSSWFGGR